MDLGPGAQEWLPIPGMGSCFLSRNLPPLNTRSEMRFVTLFFLLKDHKWLELLKKPLESAFNVFGPHKKIMSRTLKISVAL